MKGKWKSFHIFFLFLLAPFFGGWVAFHSFEASTYDAKDANSQAFASTIEDVEGTKAQTESIKGIMQQLIKLLKAEEETLKAQHFQLENLVDTTERQTAKSNEVLEKILSNLLGEPKYVHDGKQSTIKIYSLQDAGYRGYMAKVNTHTDDALKLVLADDRVVSNGEIPSRAAQRKGAILAVNAGGFWKTGNGKLAPLGITVVDGKIKTFYKNDKLSFVGFNTDGHLVGGKINTETDLKKLNVLQGSSFVPILLNDGKKLPIPKEWANTRHPRTIVGNFSNGELLFIVIDGRQEGWSKGVTLEELQDKLLSFKIKDAFNLDGGGSSVFYYNGKVLNKPSDGRERPVTSSIVILP